MYNNIIPPSRLSFGSDLHLFREGIEPKWEDSRCEHGGKWTAMVPKAQPQMLDSAWLHAVLACIGEQFDEGEEVCGIVVNVRPRQYRISLWTKTASNEAVQVGGWVGKVRVPRCGCSLLAGAARAAAGLGAAQQLQVVLGKQPKEVLGIECSLAELAWCCRWGWASS